MQLQSVWRSIYRCLRATRKNCAMLCVYGFAFYPHSDALAAAPDAVDDTFSTASATAISAYLSPNDINLDGPSDTYAKLTDPDNGTLVIDGDGSFTYTPNIGFAGADQFSYSINDGAGGSDTALVNIQVASSSDFISSANPFLITQEDTSIPLGLAVAPDLFDGGALLDIISSDIGFRADTAGATPTVFSIPAGTSSIVVTGYSTQFKNTAGADTTDDDYQLLNARIDLTSGISSGRVAFINHGRLTELDQYSWEQVTLGQSVLSDPAKVIGYHAREASDPTFKITGGSLQIIETHTLETAYHVEFMTSNGDSTNFIKAGNTVQNTGVSSSTISLPALIEPTSAKKGLIILNGLSAAAGSNSLVEHKGLSRLVIDLDSGVVSGAIAAQQGETSSNTVTYSFSNYALVDLRVGGTPTSVLSSNATFIGDTTGNASVRDDPTIYIDTAGELVIRRSATFANTFTSMYTAEFYQRTGFSSIASFVSVSSDDALFDASPIDGIDANGKPIDELLFDVPASARVGIFQASWNTIGGNDTNENIGMSFAIIDLTAGTSSGALTFIRASTPDLLAWDAVPFGQSYFGATDSSGNALYQSNKQANGFTDVFVENSAFTLAVNSDGSRTLKFTTSSNGGAQNWRDYQGNAQVSWLGNEPFQISGADSLLTGSLSHGSPTTSGGWEIDFSEIPLLSYIPDPHDTGSIELDFSLSSTGETEIIDINIQPITDPPTLSVSDATGYTGVPLVISASVVDSADVDGSETQLTTVDFSGVPTSVIFNSTSGSVVDNGGGHWTLSRTALASLLATGSAPLSTIVTVESLNTDSADIDGDSTIEDGDNGSGVDEYDELLLQTSFNLIIGELPTVTTLLTGNGTPTISGTANPGVGETLTVTVNGVTYTAGDGNLTNNGDGSWDLIIPTTAILAEGSYSVVAQLSHTDGATGIDGSTDELIVDLTPPPAPGVTSQSTQKTTPVISGTTSIGSGFTLTVTVNSITYTAGDGDLIDNGDGSWDLTIPASNELPEALYQVIATLTDAAGNTNSDPGSNELLIDLTAPAAPGVTSLTTNNTTPVISGTAATGTGDILTVEINGIVYTAGDSNLVDNGDGTWDLTIPAANALAEATYNVTATITDVALNTSTDPSIQELQVDTTAPSAPTVTTQTTASGTPLIIGTATVTSGEALTVDVNGITYTAGDGHLIDNGDSTWALTIPPADTMAEAIYEVTATVTDAAGNTSTDASNNELIIDLTPPPAPTVTFQLTNNPTPVISGTATLATGDTLSVTVNGVTYTTSNGNLVTNGDATWDLTIPIGDTLLDASYDVTAVVTDVAGNSATDNTTPDLVIDLTPPPAPGVTSQTTQNQTPVISGTTAIGSDLILGVTVNAITYTAGDGNLIDNGDGTWDLTIPTGDQIPEATYDVLATLTDAAGNASSDPGSSELVIDTTAPPSPGVTSLTTNDTTPTISGTAIVSASDTLSVEVNGIIYTANDGNLVDNGDDTWNLTIPASDSLPEATYDVTATVTDLALNTSTDPSALELLVDTTAPAAPTVTAQTTNTGTPVISGTATVNAGELLSVTVNNVTYTAGDGSLVDNNNGTWDLTIPTTETLADATYEVTATVTDGAGNTNSDSSAAELIIDLIPPPVPAVDFQLTNNATPVISGTAVIASGDTLNVTVNGITYTAGDSNLVNNGDGTWALTIPAANALTDASYNVIAALTDVAGNTANDVTNPDLVIDLTPPPAPGVTSQTTQDQTPLISGTTTIATGLTLSVTVNSATYTAGDGNLADNGDGTWDLTIPAADPIPEATYDVLATLTDAAGNASSDSGSSELVVDTTAPPTPGVTSLTTNDTTPIISGTAIVTTGDTLTVEVNGIVYTAGDGNLVDNADGTWDLTIPASNTLLEATYDVTATVTDLALNTSTDPSAQELLVDTTAPAAPAVTSQTINTGTPVISGTAIINAGEVLTVVVNGITYTAGDGKLVDNGDGTWDLTVPTTDTLTDATYEIDVTVTDGAGNTSSDNSASELIIDLVAPLPPTVTFQLTNNTNPVISGSATTTSGDTLTVDVNGITYVAGNGSLVDNGNGSWDLTIPITDALIESSYDVTTTITDLAGNTAVDITTPDLVIDLTPPPAPGVTSQTTQDQTPVISGTTTVGTGLALTVTINTKVYTAGDGNLVDNGDGTWDLTIPAGELLPEATYDIVATLTDAAGNASSDSGNSELVVDITAPPTPGVTSLTTNNTTPTISGTAIVTTGDTLTVEVNGIIYTAGDGNLLDNTDGTWDLTIPVSDLLSEAIYNVTATVTDLALNTSTDPSGQELRVDTTAPAAPAVISQTTNNGTPLISGTATINADEILTIAVNGISYSAGDGNLIDNGDGTWDLTIPAANTLPEDIYDISATITDLAGNFTVNSSVDELIIDLTAPLPLVVIIDEDTDNNSLIGAAESAANVDVTLLLPAGAAAGDTISVTDGITVTPIVLTSSDITTGSVATSFATPADGVTLTVDATLSDIAGNISAAAQDSATVDFTPTSAPNVSITEDTNNDSFINLAELTGLVDIRVSLPADAVAGDQLHIIINGTESIISLSAVNIGADSYATQLASPADGGSVVVDTRIIDRAGNTSVLATDTAVLDLTAPPVPTVISQISNSATPVINGSATVASGDTLSVQVNGINYFAGDGNLIDNSNGTWTLTIPATQAVIEATYEVVATVTDEAGTPTADATFNELIVDLTAPAAPAVTSQTTNTGTPVISGTATVGDGETLTVTVGGITYTAGDGNLIDNGDGTWDLTIPATAALADANYEVVVTIVDAAGNSTSDSSDSELIIDLISPAVPTVTAQTINTGTPVISGSATLGSGDTLTVTVNGMTYTAGDGNLVNNGDGSWDLTIPAINTLADATYNVTATVTDLAGNSTTDATLDELIIDIVAPVVPTVNTQITNSGIPVISGTATVATDDTLSVVVNAVSYIVGDGNLVDNGDGTWDLTIPPANTLPDATYDINATVSDEAGNSSTDNTTAELVIDLITPLAPTVIAQIINTVTPVISGTATVGTNETLTVIVNGIEYITGDGNLVDNGNGTWELTIPATDSLPEQIYDVTATVTDEAGNASSDVTNPDLTIDLTPPPAPGVTSQTTQNQMPVISGTAPLSTALTLTVTVNGTPYTAGDGNLIDNADGTWDLTIPTGDLLAEATYDVLATLTDIAGNSSIDPGSNELVVDITAPTTPGVTSLTTNNTTPVISGTAIVGATDTLTVEVNGILYSAGDGNLVNNADGTWDLTIPVADLLAEAIYDVTATVTDLALNTSTDPSSGELLVDTTAPVAPTVTSQTINTGVPVISGTATVGAAEVLTIVINGITYTAGDGNLVDNGDGTWDLAIPTTDTLTDNRYDVTVNVTDAAGNSSTDSSTTELVIDLVAPVAPTVTAQITNSGTPVISGTATVGAGDTLIVDVNGISYTAGDGHLVDNGDGTWDLTIPANDSLSEAPYDVTATVTDVAGNATSDITNPDLIIDVTPPPAPGVASQTTQNQTPVISGTSLISTALTLTVTVNGVTYTAGDSNLIDNADGTWDLTIPTGDLLPEATYDVLATLTDTAGNASSDSGSNELVVDITAPPTPGVTSLTTNDTTPTISGTAVVNAGETLNVEVSGIIYTAGDGNLVDNNDGTWDLTIPAFDTLAEGTYEVTATVTDLALNTSTDPSNFELLVDTTAPVAPNVIAQTTNTGTPVISGTATVEAGEILAIVVNGVTYTASDGGLTDNGDNTWDLIIPATDTLTDATYDVTATVTDAAGNNTTDSTATELIVDLISPVAPTSIAQTTNNGIPLISGTATVGTGEILTVVVNGVTYTAGDGNLTDNGDGTWDLTIPATDSLTDNTYDVTVTITDAAGNSTTNSSATELVIDLIAPVIPTVVAQISSNGTPVINGTATINSGEVLTVDVDAVTYTAGDSHLTDHGDGSWTLVIPATDTLADNTYEITATVTDTAGNATNDLSVAELIIDTLAPVIPTVTAQATNNNTPVISGSATVNPGEILAVEINGVPYTAGDGNLTDHGDGTWDLQIAASDALPDGLFDVTVSVTDAAGNTTTDISISDLVIDTISPAAPGVTSQTTMDTTPTLSGTVVNTLDSTLVFTVTVNGITYTKGDGNLVDNGDGTWDLIIPSTDAMLANTYNVTATLTDVAGNSSSDAAANELVVDLTAPATPGVTSLTTRNITPMISGTATLDTGDVLTVHVNGISYTAGDGNLLTNPDGTWDLIIPATNALAENLYDVTAIVTDTAGNTSTDLSVTELLVDLTTPTIPSATTKISASGTPVVSGNANLAVGEILTITVNDVSYTDGDGNLIYNSDGTWSLVIPPSQTLPDGLFIIQATITDGAGNVSVNNIGETLTIDTSNPTLSAQTTDTFHTDVPTFGGATSQQDGSIVVITDADGNLLCNAIVVNGSWSCTSTVALPEGVNNLIASTTDIAGNRVEAPFTAIISSDFDGDGIPNSVEGNGDSDGDGVLDAVDLDSDNDGIADINETQVDTDADGVPNYLDPDSDNDGIPDTLEATGSDHDLDFSVDNFIDINNDGLSDSLHQQTRSPIRDTDFDGIPDYKDSDSDNDGIPDIIESDGTDANNDGLIDQFTDLNGDGIDDGIFLLPTIPRDTDKDGLMDYQDIDSDNDGLSDLVESGAEDINNDNNVDSLADTDQDSIPDSVDVSQTFGFDNDQDGIDDRFDASILQLNDADNDGIADLWDPDADGDGFADTIVNGITFTRALPDTNNNGIDDLLEPLDGNILTGLRGHGGCSIATGIPTKTDPTIPLILLLSGLMVATRRSTPQAP